LQSVRHASFPLKVISGDTYSNKSWSIAAQGMFNLHEMNEIKCEICSFLDWELTVDNTILSTFEAMGQTGFSRWSYLPSDIRHNLYRIVTRLLHLQQCPSPRPAQPPPPPYPTRLHLNIFYRLHISVIRNAPCHAQHTIVVQFHIIFRFRSSTGIVDQIAGPTPAGVRHHSHHLERNLPAGSLAIRTEKPPVVHPLKGKMFVYAIPADPQWSSLWFSVGATANCVAYGHCWLSEVFSDDQDETLT
jgi:hypothetical protein